MKCEICNGEKFEKKYQLNNYEIVLCKKCKTLFNKTFLESEDFRKNLFEESYYDKIQSNAFENKLQNYKKDPSSKVYNKYLKIIEKTKKPGKVLDIGCAFGTFLKVADDRKWKVEGVEISKYSSDMIKKHWKFKVFNGDLENFKTKEKYDLITFWDVIEHTRHPRKNLEKVHKLLKDDGYLLITTDNYRSLIAFIASSIYKFSFGTIKSPVERFYIPYNSFYYDDIKFKKLLKIIGFKPIYFKKIDYPIENLNLSTIEKTIVKSIYTTGDLMNLNSQFIIIAKKIENKNKK